MYNRLQRRNTEWLPREPTYVYATNQTIWGCPHCGALLVVNDGLRLVPKEGEICGWCKNRVEPPQTPTHENLSGLWELLFDQNATIESAEDPMGAIHSFKEFFWRR
jgi:hypothetical protein